MARATAKWDQILLWDTTPEGAVTLAGDAVGFREKLIATNLLGGTVIVRPAELFEGPDYYYNDAVQESGFLRNLLRIGKASLALDPDRTLHERAEWRFRDGTVFDRGQRVSDPAEIDRIRARTFQRAETLTKLGWAPAKVQEELTEHEHKKRLNASILDSLLAVGRQFFGPFRVHETPLGRFLASPALLESRADVYHLVETDWASPIEAAQRQAFISACREALTVSTLSVTASHYGGRISELRPETFGRYSFGTAVSRTGGVDVELRAVHAFRRAMEQLLTPSERKLGMPLISALRSSDAPRIVDAIQESVSTRDRVQLSEVLYGPSEALNGSSLVILAAENTIADEALVEEAQLRIEELEKHRNSKRTGIHLLVSCGVGIVGDIVLVLLGIQAPGVSSALGTVYGWGTRDKGRPPVFGGLRKPLKRKGSTST